MTLAADKLLSSADADVSHLLLPADSPAVCPLHCSPELLHAAAAFEAHC